MRENSLTWNTILHALNMEQILDLSRKTSAGRKNSIPNTVGRMGKGENNEE